MGLGVFVVRMIPVKQEKHLLVSFLYVLIEHQSVVQITSTYPKSYNVSFALSLAACTVIPYKCMYDSLLLSHIKLKT